MLTVFVLECYTNKFILSYLVLQYLQSLSSCLAYLNTQQKVMSYMHHNNPEHQWKILADKQYQQSKLREQYQNQLKKHIKDKYFQELSQQIKDKKMSIQFQRKLQKSVDRTEVDNAIHHQQQIIDIEKLKNSFIKQTNNKIDHQNLLYEQEKKHREKQIQQLQRLIEKSKNQEQTQLLNYQKQKDDKKKQYFRHFLKDTMEEHKDRKKLFQQKDRQLQIFKLQELQKIQQRADQQRHQYLNRLKQKAKVVDYGSHSSFEQNKNKSLVQKKSQEWQTYKDSIQRSEVLSKMQQSQRMGRKVMQNYYHNQLKNQINQRQTEKREKQQRELQKDKNLMKDSENFNWMVEEQRKNLQNQQKRLLYGYLKQQQQQKNIDRKFQNAMRQREFKLNHKSLNETHDNHPVSDRQKSARYSTIDIQNSKYNYLLRPTPGDTFRIDNHRLKQLQALQKSLKKSTDIGPNQKINIDLRSHRYFASKGLNILN